MPTVIMTGSGPLAPAPMLRDGIKRSVGEALLRFAKGDNGYWYVQLEPLNDLSERLCAERHEPPKYFQTWVIWDDNGRSLRKDWNKKFGPGKEQHVHFTTDQPGYEGSWAVYDLGQAFAGTADPAFGNRIQQVFRLATTNIRHDREEPVQDMPTLQLHDIKQIGYALVGLATELETVKHDVHEVQHEVIEVRHEVREVSQRVDSLTHNGGGQQQPPLGWLTPSLALQAREINIGGIKEYRRWCGYVNEQMGSQTPFLFWVPGKKYPDRYYPPGVLELAWTRYATQNPRLF